MLTNATLTSRAKPDFQPHHHPDDVLGDGVDPAEALEADDPVDDAEKLAPVDGAAAELAPEVAHDHEEAHAPAAAPRREGVSTHDTLNAYLVQLRRALKPGGSAILATFASDGPPRCSGLPVQRYDAAQLAAELGRGFTLVESRAALHCTPAGVPQSFLYCRFRSQAIE